jgi:hypothetical protein
VGGVEDRVGKNEAIFRQVNERIAELSADYEVDALEILCECADVRCSERLTIGVEAYRQARRAVTTFVVVPAHVLPKVEEIVAEGESYVVVRKHGAAADAAAEPS